MSLGLERLYLRGLLQFGLFDRSLRSLVSYQRLRLWNINLPIYFAVLAQLHHSI
jgi:hypothetical protein